MKKTTFGIFLLLAQLILVAGQVWAADPVYREKNKYPVLERIEKMRDQWEARRDSLRDLIDADFAEKAKEKEEIRQDLRIDWSGVKVPPGPEAFDQIWHNPPTPQYYTGSCWAFCSVSYMESEAKRLGGPEVKLSEMWVVYWEYMEKARAYLKSFGHTPLAQGSQDHGTLEVYRKYGAMTADAYPGLMWEHGMHDHTPLMKELKGYLDWVLESKTWDEEQNMAYVRSILNKHMGTPPQEVPFEGKTYKPHEFLTDVLHLNMDDYVGCVSRMDEPFYTRVLLDVTDNWRRKDDYINLPLHDFYEVIKKAVRDGYTVSIGGDNSEAYMDGLHDAAMVPEWDIPAKSINQGSREFRIANGTTGDDHGVHIVGYKKYGGQDWFLIKDSNRSSRLGTFKGYYFWTGDYIKLKMLSFTIHKDRLEGLLN